MTRLVPMCLEIINYNDAYHDNSEHIQHEYIVKQFAQSLMWNCKTNAHFGHHRCSYMCPIRQVKIYMPHMIYTSGEEKHAQCVVLPRPESISIECNLCNNVIGRANEKRCLYYNVFLLSRSTSSTRSSTDTIVCDNIGITHDVIRESHVCLCYSSL